MLFRAWVGSSTTTVFVSRAVCLGRDACCVGQVGVCCVLVELQGLMGSARVMVQLLEASVPVQKPHGLMGRAVFRVAKTACSARTTCVLSAQTTPSSAQKQRDAMKGRAVMFRSTTRLETQRDVLMGCFLMEKERARTALLAARGASTHRSV